MFLHELGDDEASFTKEEMQMGYHAKSRSLLSSYLIVTDCI